MEHTGAREMSIRKAEAAILCYSSMSAASFHQLSSVAEDFKARKGFKYPPIKLICNEDDVVEEDFHETSSQADLSASEGYESGDESHQNRNGGVLKRRPSMEKIREAHEGTRINPEQVCVLLYHNPKPWRNVTLSRMSHFANAKPWYFGAIFGTSKTVFIIMLQTFMIRFQKS